VAGDAGGPRAQVARARVAPAREGDDDLLEDHLYQVIVVALTAPEHAVDRVVDDPDQPIVERRSYLAIAPLYRQDQGLVVERVGALPCRRSDETQRCFGGDDSARHGDS
jgi:hypothetical protein